MTTDPEITPVEAEILSIMEDISSVTHRVHALIQRDLPGSHHSRAMTLVDGYESIARSEMRSMGDLLTEIASARRGRLVKEQAS